MMIEESVLYVIGFLGGIGLGFFYFGGLWLTVKKIPFSSNPKWLFFLSAVFRLAPTLLVLFFAIKINPLIFLLMLPGFFGVRSFMIRRVAKRSRGQAHAT